MGIKRILIVDKDCKNIHNKKYLSLFCEDSDIKAGNNWIEINNEIHVFINRVSPILRGEKFSEIYFNSEQFSSADKFYLESRCVKIGKKKKEVFKDISEYVIEYNAKNWY